MTDPSYAAQIVTFTFPHIGNVGANAEDLEIAGRRRGRLRRARGRDRAIRASARAASSATGWRRNGKIGLVRHRHPRADPPHPPGRRAQRGDRARSATASSTLPRCSSARRTGRGSRAWTSPAACQPREAGGLGRRRLDARARAMAARRASARPHVVAIDYGSKDNIFRNLVKAGAQVTVVPAQTSLDAILALKPDGVFLSNGPGDPAATGEYAVPVIQGAARARRAGVRHLPRPPDARPRRGRADHQDAPGPPRRQPPGQAARGRRGRDHLR